MPWQARTVSEQRRAFCVLAEQGTVSFAELCRRFGISRPTGYRWRARYRAMGAGGMTNRSTRPRQCPHQTGPAVEELVCASRAAHPTWGGRKLHHWLVQQGHTGVPSPSTITVILRRHGLLAQGADPASPGHRFEADTPNALWQLDFTTPIVTPRGTATPLLILDDHSRYIVGLHALAGQTSAHVQQALTVAFRQYGLPWRILGDNGGPWGTSHAGVRLTRLIAWLARLGIAMSHGRPYHPQTQGKVERCFRTLGAEVLHGFAPATPLLLQQRFDRWRDEYNHDRPHGALAHQPPSTRFTSSPRPFPETLPPIAYEPDALLARVSGQGFITIHGTRHYLSECIRYEPVELRFSADEHQVEIWYGPIRVEVLQRRAHPPGPSAWAKV